MAGAVVDDSALGGQRDGALLLMSSLLDELAVAENLQENQTAADGDAPEHQYGAQQVEAEILAEAGISRHDYRSSHLVIPTMRAAQRRSLLSSRAGRQQIPRRGRSSE